MLKSVGRYGAWLALAASPSLAHAQTAPPTSVGAQQTSASASKAVAPGVKPYDPDEVICRYTAVTGTRFPSRACLRRADWDQLAQDSKDALNHTTMLKNKFGGRGG